MKARVKPFALCIDNSGYRILPDPAAAKPDLARDRRESGEDYPDHKDHFVFVDCPSQK